MAPPLPTLLTLSFLLAALATIFVCCTLRLLAILPNARSKLTPLRRKRPLASRVLIVLGSGGHTHEMMHLLRDLDTTKYTHRTYIVSSGDAFSAQWAARLEREFEEKERQKQRERQAQDKQGQRKDDSHGTAQRPAMQVTDVNGNTHVLDTSKGGESGPACTGPQHYDIAVVPRARKIHQPLLTTPFSAITSLFACFKPLLGATSLLADPALSATPYEAAAADVPDLIVTNGPATAVIVVLASLTLRFFNIRGAESRGKCKTMYVESFARVKTLSLSGKILLPVVDRFIVQWEELEGAGGRAEYWGILV